MPGRKPSDASWRWSSVMKALRQVTEADETLEGVTQVIDLSQPDARNGVELQLAYDNILYLGVLFGANVTGATIQVWVEVTPSDNADGPTGWTPLVGEQYALKQSTELTASTLLAIRDVYPSKVKVMVSALTDDGEDTTVSIVYSRTE